MQGLQSPKFNKSALALENAQKIDFVDFGGCGVAGPYSAVTNPGGVLWAFLITACLQLKS